VASGGFEAGGAGFGAGVCAARNPMLSSSAPAPILPAGQPRPEREVRPLGDRENQAIFVISCLLSVEAYRAHREALLDCGIVPNGTSSTDEGRVDIGSVNHGVATRAWRNLCRTGIHAMDGSRRDRAMALVAQLVDIRNIQQPRVLRAVRGVAAKATLCFYRGMFEYKRSARLGMALGTDSVLIRGRPDVVVAKGAMNIMAVTALDQPLIHFVMKRLRERRLHIRVTGITKLGLRDLQQIRFFSRRVNAMAANATNAGFEVRRAFEIRMRTYVATKAGGIDLFGGSLV
jgi:hypothetical protein